MTRKLFLLIFLGASIFVLTTTNAFSQVPQTDYISGTGNIAYFVDNQVEYSCDESIGEANCLDLCIKVVYQWETEVTSDTLSGILHIYGFQRVWERGVPFTAIANSVTEVIRFTIPSKRRFPGAIAHMSPKEFPGTNPPFDFVLQVKEIGLSGDFEVDINEIDCRQ